MRIACFWSIYACFILWCFRFFSRNSLIFHHNLLDFTGIFHFKCYILRNQITDFRRAGEFYEKAIATDPSNYVYHQNYAVLLLNDLKDYRKAKAELELLMEIKPADPKIRSNYDKLMRTKFDKDGNLKRSWKDKLRHRYPTYREVSNAYLCLRSS